MPTPTRVTIAEAKAAPLPPGRASALPLSHGSLDFSEDFAVWVMFHCPECGECPQP